MSVHQEVITRLSVMPALDDPEWTRSFRRALARLGTHAPVVVAIQRETRTVWLDVPSRSQDGRVYHVWFRDGMVACECEAGALGKPCWHAAMVWLWLHRDRRFTDPIRVRVELRLVADPARIERERAQVEAALAGVLV